MVVAIHSQPLSEFNAEAGFIVTEFIPRIAVPFFFCISGYYNIRKIIYNRLNLRKTLFGFVKPYIIWSIIYSTFRIANDIVDGNFNIKVLMDYVFRFFTIGTETFMWFFPSIIFATVFVYLLFEFKMQKCLLPLALFLFLIGCLGCSYYQIGNCIPIISELIQWDHFVDVRRAFMMGIPYYALGYLIILTENKISLKAVKIGLVISFVIEIFEMILVKSLGICGSVTMSLAILPVLYFLVLYLLMNPMPKYEKISVFSRGLSNFTYYSHSIVLLAITLLFSFSPTINFAITVFITALVGSFILKLKNKWLLSLIY